MGLHLEMSIILIFEVKAEREPVKERRRTRRKGKEMTTSGEKEQKNKKGEGKSRGRRERWHNRNGKSLDVCRRNTANLSRGGEVEVGEWMAMKNDINVAQSQARLEFENGLQFVRQYFCQVICLSPSGKLRTTQTVIFRKGKNK